MTQARNVVLVVEDEESPRETTSRMLETIGFSVIAVTNGQEGIKAVKERGGELVAIVTDQHMPMVTGAGLVLVAKHYQPAVVIIMVTASTDSGLAEDVKAAGCYFLAKPLDFQALRKILERAKESLIRDEKRSGIPDRRKEK